MIEVRKLGTYDDMDMRLSANLALRMALTCQAQAVYDGRPVTRLDTLWGLILGVSQHGAAIQPMEEPDYDNP